MAVDLSCYVSRSRDDVGEVLKSLSSEHRELFAKRFLISAVRDTNPVHKEIALDYGLDAQSIFLVSLNDKSAAGLVMDVAGMLKAALGENNIVVLHGNETRL